MKAVYIYPEDEVSVWWLLELTEVGRAMASRLFFNGEQFLSKEQVRFLYSKRNWLTEIFSKPY